MKLDPSTITISSAPAAEPVSTAEAKTHIRVDVSDDDTYIDTLVATARRYCEQVSGHAFITQTLVGGMEQWPLDNVIDLPYGPAQSVSSITYVDKDGNTDTVSSAVYALDTKRNRIYLAQDQEWPTEQMRDFDPITVTWVTGFGDASTDVPDIYVHAIKLLVGHWYENREQVIAVQGIGVAQLPLAVQSLLLVDRRY